MLLLTVRQSLWPMIAFSLWTMKTRFCEVICSILTQAGLECVPVSSAVEALAKLQTSGPFAIVLSDVIMEGMDGLTLLARIRQEHADIPVVMVTAVHDISVALAAIRNGAYDYLLKPFEREQLYGQRSAGLGKPPSSRLKTWRIKPSLSPW